jgi:uncharacterized repeat protein (TIGR03803 family)
MKSTLQSPCFFRSIHRRVECCALMLVLTLAIFTTPLVQAQTYSVLYNFTGAADGGQPVGTLVVDSQGNLYGTTKGGGNLNCSVNTLGCGVVFKFTAKGRLIVLHAFNGDTDGAEPAAGVLRNSRGEIFGTTARGGNPGCAWGNGKGCGTIYRIGSSDKETVIHSFNGLNEGAAPAAPLVQDSFGNLWGTTQFEGVSNPQCFGPGCGTLFKLGPEFGLTTYAFKGPPDDGYWPTAGLVFGPGGSLYGTTLFGGAQNEGTVYRVSATNGQVTILHSFNLATGDAANPGSLLLSGGKIYGIAGPTDSFSGGTVFQLDPTGENIFFNFSQSYNPAGNLLRDSIGNFYGQAGTTDATGILYKLDSAKNLTVLHFFGGAPIDGDNSTGMMPDGHGNLYGITSGGGTTGAGTIFKLTP